MNSSTAEGFELIIDSSVGFRQKTCKRYQVMEGERKAV